MNLEHLEKLRLSELSLVVNEIKKEKPNGVNLLEIGAGSGWQAKKLSEHGYLVQAIDIEDSNYSNQRIWQITDYDGKQIPFDDEKFDVIFSSNVLEHIPHLEQFQNEIKRVLKADGIAIHLVPSGSWSFWTIITHYPFILKLIMVKIFSVRNTVMEYDDTNEATTSNSNEIKTTLFDKLINKTRNGILPRRHGERGNVVTEMYYFSKTWWMSFFNNTGWEISKYSTNQLFYTGYSIFGSLLPIDTRKRLSTLLGSSCHLFLLRK